MKIITIRENKTIVLSYTLKCLISLLTTQSEISVQFRKIYFLRTWASSLKRWPMIRSCSPTKLYNKIIFDDWGPFRLDLEINIKSFTLFIHKSQVSIYTYETIENWPFSSSFLLQYAKTCERFFIDICGFHMNQKFMNETSQRYE